MWSKKIICIWFNIVGCGTDNYIIVSKCSINELKVIFKNRPVKQNEIHTKLVTLSYGY